MDEICSKGVANTQSFPPKNTEQMMIQLSKNKKTIIEHNTVKRVRLFCTKII
jgi:hypothetical protein